MARSGKYTDKRWILDSCTKAKGATSCTPYRLRDVIDYDYVKSLDAEDALWLANFTDAYYTGNKNDVSNSWSVQELRDSYKRNNDRIRCMQDALPLYRPEGVAGVTDLEQLIIDIDTEDMTECEILDYLEIPPKHRLRRRCKKYG